MIMSHYAVAYATQWADKKEVGCLMADRDDILSRMSRAASDSLAVQLYSLLDAEEYNAGPAGIGDGKYYTHAELTDALDRLVAMPDLSTWGPECAFLLVLLTGMAAAKLRRCFIWYF